MNILVTGANGQLGRELRRASLYSNEHFIFSDISGTPGEEIVYLDVADKVSVQLQLTDPTARSRDRVVKKSEKDSLYAAMDVAAIWLDRALAGKEK